MDTKWLVFVCVLTTTITDLSLAANVGAAKAANEDGNQEKIKQYFSMMESIDVDQILNNTRLMTNNVKCFLNEGPCTGQLREMIKMIPMLIKDTCLSCTREQKNMMKKAIDAIKARRPNDYEQLSKFFDPEGKYEKKFLEILNESK